MLARANLEEAVANLGEETENPKRDLPIGLLGTLGVATLLRHCARQYAPKGRSNCQWL